MATPVTVPDKSPTKGRPLSGVTRHTGTVPSGEMRGCGAASDDPHHPGKSLVDKIIVPPNDEAKTSHKAYAVLYFYDEGVVGSGHFTSHGPKGICT